MVLKHQALTIILTGKWFINFLQYLIFKHVLLSDSSVMQGLYVLEIKTANKKCLTRLKKQGRGYVCLGVQYIMDVFT